MDYRSIAKKADTLLKRTGLRIKVTRAGASVGTGYGVFDDAPKENDPGFLQAQTIIGERVLYLSGLTKPPEVNDVIEADKDRWTITSLIAVRPATTTVLYILKVS